MKNSNCFRCLPIFWRYATQKKVANIDRNEKSGKLPRTFLSIVNKVTKDYFGVICTVAFIFNGRDGIE